MTLLKYRGREFRATIRMSAAALAMVAALVALGNWQTRRAEEKLTLQSRFDDRARDAVLSISGAAANAPDLEYRRVAVRGKWVAGHTMLLDNRVLRGVVGYEVLTPLKIDGSDMHVIVERGWVAAGARRDDLPRIITPSEEVLIEGIALAPPKSYFELGEEAPAGPVIEHLRLERIGQHTGLQLQPFVLRQTGDSDDALLRSWDRPDTGADRHRGYALQWYALALLTLILYVACSIKRI